MNSEGLMGAWRWRLIVLASVTAVAAAGCGSASSGGGSGASQGLPSTVKIGVLDSMTGTNAGCGTLETQGEKLALSEAASKKMLGATKVSLDIADDKGDPEDGVSAFRSLQNDNVAMIVGPCNGTVGTAVAPLADRAGIPDVITTASAAPVTSKWVFRAGIPQEQYAANAIKVIASQGHKNVAVIYDKSQASIAKPIWSDTQKPAIAAAGMKLVAEVPVTSDTTDFSSQVAQIIRAKPDAVGILLQGAPNLTVAKQLREAGYKGTLWGHQSTAQDYYIKGPPSVVNGTVISVSYAPNLASPGAKQFTQLYRAKYGVDPTELVAHGYDAMMMALTALKRAQSTNPDKVQTALSSIKSMDGAQGPLTFTADGDARGKAGAVEVKNGKLVGVAVPSGS